MTSWGPEPVACSYMFGPSRRLKLPCAGGPERPASCRDRCEGHGSDPYGACWRALALKITVEDTDEGVLIT